MKSYEDLLEEAYKKIKVVTASSDRFETPRVQGQVQGKNTIITNIGEIASYLRRPADQIAKFNDKIALYTKEFVLCAECKKPDTEVISEKGIKFKHCLACGAKSPIRYNL